MLCKYLRYHKCMVNMVSSIMQIAPTKLTTLVRYIYYLAIFLSLRVGPHHMNEWSITDIICQNIIHKTQWERERERVSLHVKLDAINQNSKWHPKERVNEIISTKNIRQISHKIKPLFVWTIGFVSVFSLILFHTYISLENYLAYIF